MSIHIRVTSVTADMFAICRSSRQNALYKGADFAIGQLFLYYLLICAKLKIT